MKSYSALESANVQKYQRSALLYMELLDSPSVTQKTE